MSKNGHFLAEVRNMPGGSAINECIQCGTCTGSCPNASRMDFAPRKVIAMVRAGLRDEVLSCNTMWYCATCYLCTVRCPREIKPTEIMHALESIAINSGLVNKRLSTPIFYQAFVDSINSNGRSHEFGIMMKYYMRTFWSKLKRNPFSAMKMVSLIKMMPFALKLLLRGRLPIRATKIHGCDELKTMIDKAHSLGGAR